ncbi:DUF4124 domain-containing protein [Chitinimonas sp. BJB300]|uniref:DUF4124 domain-containing protein n=1 Tax=Chitinimonas sp. BJB300 TaxID=1559339 RepID=UPI000C0F8E0C|nr:DUF4124 domain-containing protein [Chitinimonas sp. BJB300]PHV11400.1 hypothetical protein CSQ89_11030 [Chitinimonas sp. BJB300]TSJ90998.1 DUF4124 domain-containing protein [Chitinimonas sp. BJB300]
MRVLFVLIAAGAAIGWWQRDAIDAMLNPPKPPAPVYRWTDAKGQLHYSDTPTKQAIEVQLKPLNTVKGMSPAEIAAANKPRSAATPPAQNQPPDCDAEDAATQARCIAAHTVPRNLALERMEKAAQKLIN